MYKNPFSRGELDNRLQAVRAEMARRDVDIAVLCAPENVFYLIGLEHWGYFAVHYLIVPLSGELILITRQMEQACVDNQVVNARFSGHSDSVSAESHLLLELKSLRASEKVVGFEFSSVGFTYSASQAMAAYIDSPSWVDISGLVDDLRLVKSVEEQGFMRQAAAITDVATRATIAAICDGAKEADVAAECLRAMTVAGGSPPGFGPFIRPEWRVAEAHTSWGDGRYKSAESVFLEIAGCVGRYNAPLGRLVHIGSIRDEDAEMAEICANSFNAAFAVLRPGIYACDAYSAWQDVVDAAGMSHYRRHHCGYCVGIGFPPAWVGGNNIRGLRDDSRLALKAGMTFHLMSWFSETGRGNCLISNTVLLGETGAEILTKVPFGPTVL